MALNLNGTIWAHSDASATITPTEGPNAGIARSFSKLKSFKYDPGAGSALLDGTDVGPEGIAPTAAKPTWEMGLSSVAEVQSVADHLQGDVGGAVQTHCNVTIVWSRPGKPSVTISIVDTLVTKGLGGESDSGKAPDGTCGGSCVDILQNKVSLLNKRKIQ